MGVLETTYNEAMAKPLQVLGIFNDFYGEDRVDMQGFPTYSQVASALPEGSSVAQVKNWITCHTTSECSGRGFILVHFPRVFIKNEHDRGTEIKHLYAKIYIDIEGRMYSRFLLNRAEYSMLHITNGYMHSHVSSIPFNHFTDFQSPCTGTGPINTTMYSLSSNFDEDIWRLFCLELSKYVEVESIAGVPYHRLESLTRGGRMYTTEVAQVLNMRENLDNNQFVYQTFNRASIAAFTKYLIDSDVLKFRFDGKEYQLAMSPTDCAIRVSNCFIDWYNREYRAGRQNIQLSHLLSTRLLSACKFNNGKLTVTTNSINPSSYLHYIGQQVCTFKGQPVTITIPDIAANNTVEENTVMILKTEIIEYILTKIINVINFRYGNKRNEEDTSGKTTYFL